MPFRGDGLISIRVDDRSLKRAFSNLEQVQMPFAIATAMTEIALGAQADLQADMQRVFDRPTPFTIKSFYVKRARKTDPTAWVGIRDWAPKGTAAWKYLEPQVEGGPRRMKRMETLLSPLSGGQYVVPGPGAKLDAYGNMSRGQLQQILSQLGALADPAQNMTDRTTKRLKRKGAIARGQKASFFIAHDKGGRAKGVYQLVSPGKVAAVLIFTPKAPTYRPIFDPDAVFLAAVERHGEGALDRALAHAVATAK